MGKFSNTHSFFFLALIFSVAFMVPCANSQKRCLEQLYANGCTLEDCGKKCYQRHNAFKMQPRPTIFAFASGIVVDPLMIIVFNCILITISTCNLQE